MEKMKFSFIDLDSVEMTFDIMKYVLSRISDTDRKLGKPRSYDQLKKDVGETVTPKGIGGQQALDYFKDILVKATIAEDHPRNLAFVPAAPSKASVLFDVITAASCIQGAYWMIGAGGIFCEMEAMKWLIQITGLPEGSFGVFTSGGTAANLSALLVAREQWLEKNEENSIKKSLLITSRGAHSSVKQMAKVMGSDLLFVEDNEEDRMTGHTLTQCIEQLSPEDRQRLFAVVCTSGTTNAGIIDDLDSIASVCAEQKLWMHVDGAYGGAARAVPRVQHLFKGMERADSITIDPHKWLFTPYDCGAVLYRNMALAKKAHSQQGSYLDIFNEDQVNGFNPSDYQIQLTRRLRGLPLWFSLAMHGTETYIYNIDRGLKLAEQSEQLIQETDYLELVRPHSLSVVLFKRIGWTKEDYIQWTKNNLNSGFALVTPTTWVKNGQSESVARFCFINPNTTIEDVQLIIDSMK